MIKDALHGLSELIWPRTCHVCGALLPSHSEFICAGCMASLPRIPISSDAPTATQSRLSGCPGLEKAASWLFYSKHLDSADLLHDIKYHGHSRLARFLGREMALDLIPTGFFADVDCIVPIPLHFLRQMRRGYNQSDMLAQGIADILKLPVEYPLTARRHKSQTLLHTEKRMRNVVEVYSVHRNHPLLVPGATSYRHILLVDDVCTTGSTLTQAANELVKARSDLRISVLTLALTTSH